MEDYDFSMTTSEVRPEVVLKEHPHDGGPVSYMAVGNLKNAMHEINEILDMMNMQDDLPQWADQMLAEATDRLSTVKAYILSIKDV
jgi:hypothetical protein